LPFPLSVQHSFLLNIFSKFYGPELQFGFGLGKITPFSVETQRVKQPSQFGLTYICNSAHASLEMFQNACSYFANAKLQRQNYMHFLKVSFE